ncbi:MAG: hypothetical protein V2A58_05870, partial [Planctomycetota bacterium]
MAELDIFERRTVSVLAPELREQVKRMRMRLALWEAGCLVHNEDHGPRSVPDLMPALPVERYRIYTG